MVGEHGDLLAGLVHVLQAVQGDGFALGHGRLLACGRSGPRDGRGKGAECRLCPMTLTELRYLVAVARELHFGRAAEVCAISQPALSMQIREMEAVLGSDLFERGARQVRLAFPQAVGIFVLPPSLDELERRLRGRRARTRRPRGARASDCAQRSLLAGEADQRGQRVDGGHGDLEVVAHGPVRFAHQLADLAQVALRQCRRQQLAGRCLACSWRSEKDKSVDACVKCVLNILPALW